MAEKFANATAYDRMTGRWSARLAPLFLDFAGISGSGRILDVGCGTGLERNTAGDAPGRNGCRV